MMEWRKLLCPDRVKPPEVLAEQQRSIFQRDYDRIVFCSAFRRLQDKTQVHPFPSSDFVRRRLTHSLEVSCVGRSLGYWLGKRIAESNSDLLDAQPNLPHDVGQIVANACLAHDIGNPPFGHAGEMAIGSWFTDAGNKQALVDMDAQEIADFEKFEGNAQGFRLLTRLQDYRDDGGLRLSYATLAAFTKYPTASAIADKDAAYIGEKKHGFFKEDMACFEDVAERVGLLKRREHAWCRHPLVYLVEAADDICYRVIDVEDALKLGRVSYAEAEEAFVDLLAPDRPYTPNSDKEANINWLRAVAINDLITAAMAAYERHEADIMAGTFNVSLLDAVSNAERIKKAKKLIKEQVFKWDRTISAEIAGSQMIVDVLDRCMRGIEEPSSHIGSLIVSTIPRYSAEDAWTKKVLAVTDYVSGMTDTYLRNTYLRLTGHAMH